MPIFHKAVQQGSDKWLQMRSGVPTSSLFDRIVTPGGAASKSSEPYMMALLFERIVGHPIQEHISLWMKRGSVLERDAVADYELRRDVDTEPVGFVTNDAGTIGASPDRLVGNDGLFEAKCPSEPVMMSYLLKRGAAYTAYKVQVQGQLWIAEREWCDLYAFHPELPRAIQRIERDEKFISAHLAPLVTAFSEELEKLYSTCGITAADAPEPERSDEYSRDALLRALKESLVEVAKK